MKIQFGPEERLEAHTFCLEIINDSLGITLEDIATSMRDSYSSAGKLYEHMTSAGAAMLISPLVEKQITLTPLSTTVDELVRWYNGHVEKMPVLDMEFSGNELFCYESVDLIRRESPDQFSQFIHQRVNNDSLYTASQEQAYAQLAEAFVAGYPEKYS